MEGGSTKSQRLIARREESVMTSLTSSDGSIEVVPFRTGEEAWSISWKQAD